MKQHSKKISIIKVLLALGPMALALPLAMDIYVPAIPSLTQLFHTTPGIMQLTLNLFMLFSGIMQLFIGPIADHFGRRSISFVLIAIFACGCILSAASHSMSGLIIGRLIQAIGSCGMLVLSFTIARDLFDGTQLAQSYSFLNGIISFSPMFAPFIGSLLDIKYGWQATFEALIVVAAIAFINYFFLLKETWPKKNRIPLQPDILKQYIKIATEPRFALYALSAGIGLIYLFLFCAISPILIMTKLGIPESHYGYYFCFMGISFLFGSMFSASIVTKIGIYKTVLLGFIITLIGGIIMLSWYLLYGLSIGNFVIPMLLIGLGGTCSMGAGSAGATIDYKKQAGIAASLSSGFRFIFAAIIGLIISRHINSTLPLSIPAIIGSIIGIILFLRYKHLLEFSDNDS